MAGHRSLEPAVVVRIHPGQSLHPATSLPPIRLSPIPVFWRGFSSLSPSLPAGLQSAVRTPTRLQEAGPERPTEFRGRLHRTPSTRQPGRSADGAVTSRSAGSVSGSKADSTGTLVLRTLAGSGEGRLLETLEEVGKISSRGTDGSSGQRIRYLGDMGRWQEAEELARGCRGWARLVVSRPL